MVIGSGPIVIGQACEFDYSGTQACRVLREEGIRVILVNSNPATIMTDPEFADATYIEPITPEFVEKVIAKERPDALLATLGGQTALNAAIQMHESGVLKKYDVELIGASIEAIEKGENRESFKKVVESLPKEWGAESANSVICHTMDECLAGVPELGGYPVVVRPSFTMGGSGSGLAYNEEDLHRIAGSGLALSPTTEVLLEESILGWKEYELEVMRDTADNVVIVCSIENFDPMGVHTGDSITVAPAMTLTDVEYQRLRDISIGIIREVGVDTGGCNIQFAVNPDDGRIVVIEMNPRVSRSSALASKATGFPIAKIAAKVAIGYTLDEIPNDITQVTPASFEPTLDYVVVKVPRFAFEKFPNADATLTTHMKSVGEAMAIGRNFTEALQKALRSLERPDSVFDWNQKWVDLDKAALLEEIAIPHDGRIKKVMDAIRAGATPQEIFDATKIDPWFVDQLALINEIAVELIDAKELSPALLRKAKRHGFSDAQIGKIRGLREDVVRGVRHALGVRPVYKTVDTCAAEFAATTPYHYSSYDEETEVEPRTKEAVLILGSGPNRIGQGIEFDYSCVHAAMALSEVGYETDHGQLQPRDRLDRLRHLRPPLLRAADARGRARGRARRAAGRTGCRRHRAARRSDSAGPRRGARGGWRADRRHAAGGDRPRRGARSVRQGARRRRICPRPSTAWRRRSATPARSPPRSAIPVLVRPSYVLGGRGMEIVYDEGTLKDYIDRATEISPERPVLVDRFLDDAIEIDVDALYDGDRAVPRRRHGAHRGGRRALRRLGLRPAADHARRPGDPAHPRVDRSHRQGRRRTRTDQHPVRAELRHPLRHRGQPARVAHGPVRLQGDGDSAGQGCRATDAGRVDRRSAQGWRAAGDRRRGRPARLGAHRGQGSGHAVQPVPHLRGQVRRHAARPRDAVDRRGHGHGPRVRHGVRQVAGRRPERSPDLGQGVRLGRQPRQAAHDLPGQAARRPRLRDPRDQRHGGRARPQRRPGHGDPQAQRGAAGRASPAARSSRRSTQQDVQLIINTPHGVTAGGNARIDGYEIRTAAVAEGIPCITTVQGLAAAVQGIEALIEGKIGVTSLQEWGQIVTAGRDA